MRALTANDLLRFWEWGQAQHPVDRALCCLSLAFPEQSWDDLAALSIGQRNVGLLQIHSGLFGQEIHCFVQCPACGVGLEFHVALSDLPALQAPETREKENETRAGDIAVRFRLLDSRDLAAVALLPEPLVGQRLLQRSILSIHGGATPLEINGLPDFVIEALSEEMSLRDPGGELLFQLNCDQCGNEWSAILDAMGFLWTEISSYAKRLFYQVDRLARVYGWDETSILAMSEARRRIYLEMAQGSSI